MKTQVSGTLKPPNVERANNRMSAAGRAVVKKDHWQPDVRSGIGDRSPIGLREERTPLLSSGP